MHENDFNRLLDNVKEISALIPGAVFIGGVAVFLHASKTMQEIAEASHDADLFIGLCDLADLRDIEELTSNRRLDKQQFIKDGFEFDVYVERNNSLAVPYDDILLCSSNINDIRVASLGHLLILKSDAAISRKGSAKGQKDMRDIIRILMLCSKSDIDICRPYLDDGRMSFLQSIQKSSSFLSLAEENAVLAKHYRQRVSFTLESIFPEPRSCLSPEKGRLR